LAQDASCLFLGGFAAYFGVVVFPGLVVRLVQEFLPEGFIAQALWARGY
jgi:hypothetical protein